MVELTTFDIWMEGYSCNLDSQKARFVASNIQATSFREACINHSKVDKDFKDFFDEKRLTYWAVIYSIMKKMQERILVETIKGINTMKQKTTLTPVININISKSELLKAIQFRFNMVTDEATIVLLEGHCCMRLTYGSTFLGCNIDNNLFIDFEWADGLLKRHIDANLTKYKLHAINILLQFGEHYRVTFKLCR